ncbi:MAG: SDR family oxidoreductase [Thermoflavifilum sp.]|nr:SDR family oxidoreductase [Thermoflavifilum sp.]
MPVALILGATSDIAQAIAKQLAKENFNLILAARNIDYLKRIQHDLQVRYSIQVDTVYFDAISFDQHEHFIQQLSVFPELVILCFGYLGNQNAAEKNWEEAYKILSTNYLGAVSILNRIANEMEKRKKGTIVAISSVAGDRGRKSNYLYGSAKAGLTAYLSGLRNRLYSSGINVITVKPGYVATKMTENMSLPQILVASPEQVAKRIWKAIHGRKNTIYVKKLWLWIMFIIKIIPEPIFKRLNM